MSKSKLNYKVYNGKALSKIFENSKIYFLSAMLISGIIIGASVIKNSSELSSMVSEIAEEFVKARDGKGIIGNFVDSLKVSISFNAATVFMGFSTHKLRHTAATLMYQHGNVDPLQLKEILGHENLSTTEIYTHIHNEQLKQAVDSNPLNNPSNFKKTGE